MLGLAGAAFSAPEADRILPVDKYTTEKARALAKAHLGALRDLNAFIYHCVPWVETEKMSIGFSESSSSRIPRRPLLRSTTATVPRPCSRGTWDSS